MSMVDEVPHAPAAAYFEMARILPERFFLESLVYEGVELTVTGHDRIATFWRLPVALADAVIPALGSLPVRVKHKRFNDRGRRRDDDLT